MDINTKMLSQILEKAPEYIFWKDEASIYQGCNKNFALLAGFDSPGQVIGKKDNDMPWAQYSSEIYLEEDQLIIETGAHILHKEVPMKFGNQSEEKYLSISKVPLYDNDKIVGIIGIFIDITQRKKIEEDLRLSKQKTEKVSKAKSEFIANMSHDIRTPMTGMIGMAQDLLYTMQKIKATLNEKKQLSSIEWMEIINHIEDDSHIFIDSTTQLLTLCNEILEITHLEDGVLPEAPVTFDLHDIINRNIALSKPVSRDKKLDLLLEIDPALPRYVVGLKEYINHSLLNLLSNALKFTQEGYVKLSVSLKEKKYKKGDSIYIQFMIEDTGIGIPEDKHKVVFDYLSRLTPSYQGVYKGSGLGLYTVKRYVEAMHGTINVKSKLGQGACFVLTIPFVISDTLLDNNQLKSLVKEEQLLNQSKLLSNATTESKVIHLLVVEDSPIAAIGITAILKSLNCTVEIAESGEAAIDKVGSNHYSLILMDMGLPGIDGIETTKKIRALNDCKKANIPIVALTGHANNPGMIKDCLDAGMQRVISKPTTREELEFVFKEYLGG